MRVATIAAHATSKERACPCGTGWRRQARWARALVVLAAAVVALLVAGAAADAQPKFPELTGRVVDEAGLIPAADRAAITEQLRVLEEKSTDQVVVFTTRSLQGYTIEDYGYQLGRKWGIGQKGKDNGAILIVAPNERKVRIEVGRGLEPHLTDVMSKLIIENAILPAFRRGDFLGGIKAGVRDINDVVLGDVEAVKQRAKGNRQGPPVDYVALLIMAFWIAIFLGIVYAHWRNAHQSPPGAGQTMDQSRGQRTSRRRRSGWSDVIVVPSGSGSWGGGWSGGSGGGGGWSGGGGDFGGGGSSGSW